MDDMIIFLTDLMSIENTKKFFCLKFDTKDMGDADVILGLKILKNFEGIVLSQKVLHGFKIFGENGVSTPFHPSVKLSKNKGESISQIDYSQVSSYWMFNVYHELN